MRLGRGRIDKGYIHGYTYDVIVWGIYYVVGCRGVTHLSLRVPPARPRLADAEWKRQ